MDRREFLKACAGGLCVAALPPRWQTPAAARAAGNAGATLAGPMVGVHRFGEVSEARGAVQAVLEKIGGLERIVRKGDRVVIKPNLVNCAGGRWVGRVTQPTVMEGVLQAVVECGGRPVVAEGTCEELYGTTVGFAREIGLMDVCKRYGAEFIDINAEEPRAVTVPRPVLWPRFHLTPTVVECDRFISVPVMKTHYNAGFTLGMKNLVGTLSAQHYAPERGGWDRQGFHEGSRELWQHRYGVGPGETEALGSLQIRAAVADLASARPIDLVVVDGIYGEERQSPTGGAADLVGIKERAGSYLVLAGTNCVAVDAVGAHLMRIPPEHRQQLDFAEAKGLGTADLKQIRFVGERLEDVAVPMRSGILSQG